MNTPEFVLHLNQLALDLVAADFSDGHMPSQGGPTRTSRALAIIHLAIHDAYAITTGAFAPRLAVPPVRPPGLAPSDENAVVAAGAAAFAACGRLYPDGGERIRASAAIYWKSFARNQPSNTLADTLGLAVAAAWDKERADDGSNAPERYTPGNEPGKHRVDPAHPDQGFLHPAWGFVRPFVVGDVAMDAPLLPPPDLDTKEYAEAFDEVVKVGGSGSPAKDRDSRARAVTGIFWGYDGANRLGTPPRLYNQILRRIVEDLVAAGTAPSAANAVRLFAGANAAMADAGIAAWYWKYIYNFWRPVVGIREADPGWGPTGRGDGNALRAKAGNPFWLPLGAPATNAVLGGGKAAVENFTPNFPAYPSGHATFGTACFEFAAAFLGKTLDTVRVEFVSDEFNGRSTDNRGVVRPALVRRFTLREAIEVNKVSRIYLGVHWLFDATGGETVGKAIATTASAKFPAV